MLTDPQKAALDVLLAGGTGVQASKAAGVSETIISRWRTRPEFARALAAAQASKMYDVCALVPAAMKTIKEVLRTGNATVRARVAIFVVEHAYRLTEEAQLLQEMQEVRDDIDRLKEGDTDRAEGGAGEPQDQLIPGPGPDHTAIPGGPHLRHEGGRLTA